MSNNTDTIILWGREFRRNKDGLDEEQVTAFVKELIFERDLLRSYQDHLVLLAKKVEQEEEETRQSCKKILEQAKTEADAITAQAQEQGKQIIEGKKAEGDDITAQAQEQGRQIIEGKKTEALVQASIVVETIKDDARKQAELVLEETTRARSELREITDRVYLDLVTQLGSLKQRLDSSDVGFGLRLPQPSDQTTTPPSESQETETEPTKPAGPAPKPFSEWELQVLPPLSIKYTMQIVASLSSLPEVRNTEFFPEADRALIIVYLKKPLKVIDVLKGMPHVAEVREETTSDNGNSKKEHRAILTLAKQSIIQPSKRGQSFQIN